jgi:protein SHQ1
MKQILDHHEVYYVYSKVWVDDFCSWTQIYARFVQPYRLMLAVAERSVSRSDEILNELGELMSKATVTKSSIGWDLEALEAATLEAINREADSDDE